MAEIGDVVGVRDGDDRVDVVLGRRADGVPGGRSLPDGLLPRCGGPLRRGLLRGGLLFALDAFFEVDRFAAGFAAGVFDFAASTEAFSAAMRSTTRAAGASRAPRSARRRSSSRRCRAALAVLVGELLGVPRPGEAVDRLLCHLDLVVADLAVGVQGVEVGDPDLVGPVHRLEHEHLVLEPGAARCSLSRKLTFATPTLFSRASALRRSAYALAPVSSGTR